MISRCAGATLLLFGVTQVWVFAQPASIEYDVKAAFVLNFTRYVEWPPTRRTAPFHLCVLRDNPFSGRLRAVVAGESWEEGPLDVVTVPDMRQAADCHLLYVPASADGVFAAGRALLNARPVLTVGEHERFLDHEGMIRLFLEQNKVRFSINQRSAAAAGLQISSRLLRLARTVVGTTGTP